MKNRNLHLTITANASASEALKKISQVNLWWSKDFRGKAEKLNDAFAVHFGDRFVKFKINEAIPDKKIVWHVTECHDWTPDNDEWIGTDIVFEVSEKAGIKTLNFTHIGLVPDVECYDDCEAGWTNYITKSLRMLLETGKGLPYEGHPFN